MSNMLKSMKKNIEVTKLKFVPSMYNNVYGSVVISAYILNPKNDEIDVKNINRLWRKIEKNPNKYINFGLEDKDFIDKTLKLFNVERPSVFPIAMVQSSVNVLFAPYYDGTIYPLREDGFMSVTLNNGKIYPIDFGENKEEIKD